jgi:phosphatidylserine/phosphatidylglycerophosphate/cardiolipin synthase-like enzyme
MRSVLALVTLGVCSLIACSKGSDDSPNASEDHLTSGTITANIEHALMLRNPQDRDIAWTVSPGNALSGDWLLQMPRMNFWGATAIPGPRACSGAGCLPDFGLATCNSDAECGGGRCVELQATKRSDGDFAHRVCAGHSDAILDEIYKLITSAHTFVDITTLSPPTGRFLATIRDALDTLAVRTTGAVGVRLLVGDVLKNEPDIQALFQELTRDLTPFAQISLSIGAHRESLATWNHSKIIAVDGREAIIGGMNLWSDHYLDENPVHDVSLHLHGPIAQTAQIFANALWEEPCGDQKIVGLRGNGCPRPYVPVAVPAAGNVQMMGVGRLGKGQSNGFNHNPSDTALVTLMNQARSSIRISQQDIGSFKILGNGTLPQAYMDAWIMAAARGVTVDVVVSNPGSFGGKGTTDADSYSNGWALSDLSTGLMRRADQIMRGHDAEMCQRVHFSTVRSSTAATWPNGRPLANHAKVVIVDDQAFYVGSQNLYDADLAEYGVIVDDQDATRQFIGDYWSKLSSFSSAATFRDTTFCR